MSIHIEALSGNLGLSDLSMIFYLESSSVISVVISTSLRNEAI